MTSAAATSPVMTAIKDALCAASNVHRQGQRRNIFLFASPRGGSTWMMELLASQPGMKYFDEPFNIRRRKVQKAGRFRDWYSVMPGSDDLDAIVSYLNDLASNRRHRFMNPPPFRRNHRWLTNRVVFKLHELEHRINDIKERCGGVVVFLLRHPIPTTLSRAQLPRLEFFRTSEVFRERYISAEQQREIDDLLSRGSWLQKGVVSWCYQNLLPLKHMDSSDWTFVTYEELLLNSRAMCRFLYDRLDLDDLSAMQAAVNEPATNITMSHRSTLEILNDDDIMRRNLGMVTKWRSRLSSGDERRAFEIMELFGLDTYSLGRCIAHDRYLHDPEVMNRYAHIKQADDHLGVRERSGAP